MKMRAAPRQLSLVRSYHKYFLLLKKHCFGEVLWSSLSLVEKLVLARTSKLDAMELSSLLRKTLHIKTEYHYTNKLKSMKLSSALPFLLSVAASPTFGSSSKSSKSNAEDCPPVTQEVSCNSTFNSGVITLGKDVTCNENIEEAVGERDAAITVSGVGTVFDCNGHSVRQVTNSSAAAQDCTVFPSSGNAAKILEMKKTCGLFYAWGITATNGAVVRNCNVQKFWGGAEILDGGTVENSEFSLNYRGLEVLNFNDNTQSIVKKRYVRVLNCCVVFLCMLSCLLMLHNDFVCKYLLHTVSSTTITKDLLCSRNSMMVEQPSFSKM